MHESVLTTQSVPPRRRADYWEEMVSQQFVPTRCLTTTCSTFRAYIRSRDIDTVTLSEVRSQGTDVLRTSQHVACSSTNYFLLSLQVLGMGQLTQAGRSVVLHPGDMALYDTARAYDLRFADEQQQLVLRIPREELLVRCPEAESRVGIRVAAATPAARLVNDLVRSVAALDALPSEHSRRSLAATLMDLVLDGLNPKAPSISMPPVPPLLSRAQLLAEKHLPEHNFTVARWAADLGISERYLRALFAACGQSPAQYLWQQRLGRAANHLRDTEFREQRITDIALACGFNDSAHFSHAFRTAFGMTPSGYRQGAAKKSPGSKTDRA